MKIKMLTTGGSAKLSFAAGDVVDFPEKEALLMIENEHAVKAPPKSVAVGKVETARSVRGAGKPDVQPPPVEGEGPGDLDTENAADWRDESKKDD